MEQVEVKQGGQALGPCPFCGGTKTIIAWEDEPHFYLVGCKTCCTQGPSKLTEAEAIAAWNERPTETNLTALLDQAEEALGELVAWHHTPDQGSVFRQIATVGKLYDQAEKALTAIREGRGK